MNCINYNCDDLEPHTLNEDCGDNLLGGLSDAVLLDCNTNLVDPTNGTQVLAEIAAGRAWIVRNIKVGIPLGSPVQIDALKACGTQTLVTYNRTGTWVDGNVNQFNIETFYNSVFRGRSFGGMILKECGNPNAKITFIDAEITFTGDRVIPDNNNELQRFEGTFSWKSKDLPRQLNEPVGVFV
ncbi:MAG: hypothetical protein ACHQ1D_00210 [Nitrososphaerales archaeon]